MKLDKKALSIITTSRNNGNTWNSIVRSLRTQGYTQVRGGRLSQADLCNFVRKFGTTTVETPVTTTVASPVTPVLNTRLVTEILASNLTRDSKRVIVNAFL